MACLSMRRLISEIFKTRTWKEYMFGWMSHLTYVISLSPQAKWYVLIWFKYLIPLTCLNFFINHLKENTNSRCRFIEWSSNIWCCIIVSRCYKTRFFPNLGTEVSSRNAQTISHRAHFQNLYGNNSFGFYCNCRWCWVIAQK